MVKTHLNACPFFATKPVIQPFLSHTRLPVGLQGLNVGRVHHRWPITRTLPPKQSYNNFARCNVNFDIKTECVKTTHRHPTDNKTTC